MNESLRVRQVGSVENGLALFEDAGRLAVVDHGWGQQAEAGMTMLVVVPREELLPESATVLNRADALGELSVITHKMSILRRTAQVFFADASRSDRAAFERFCENASSWLDDYALFMASKDEHHGTIWTSWDSEIGRRDPKSIREWSRKLAPELQAFK